MVNVEADVLAGPLLARQGAHRPAWSIRLAYGDQPALIAEQVDWARACGFDVVAAGKGTKYLPAYHALDARDGVGPLRPDAGAGQARRHEPADVQLLPRRHQVGDRDGGGRQRDRPDAGAGRALDFPPCGVDDLPRVLRPKAEGGMLDHKGQVEVISSLERDGRPVFRDLRWGVYVVFEAPSDYVKRCFAEYGLVTDPSRPLHARCTSRIHLIGLELGISVASAGLRGEADRRADRLPRRRGRDRQARPAGRRDAGRRRRLHGLGQADAGGGRRCASAACRSASRTTSS